MAKKRRKEKRLEEEAVDVEERDDAEASPPASEEPEGSDDDAVEQEEEEPTWWEDFRDYYLSFDRRTLGMARIFLGFFLICDLFRRTWDWWKMFSNDGVLPAHYNLWRPQSNGWTLLNGFAERQELWALWGFILFVYVMLLVGYKTKIWQILAAIIVASLNGRVLLIENGGYVVHNLLMLWTAFLPMGDRFSVDSFLASMRTQKERGAVDLNNRETDTARWRLKPHVGWVGLVVLLQLAAIYGFNVVHKTGPAWHNGTAVHFVIWVDRMVNPLIAHAREYAPPFVMIILTKSVMGMEAGMPVAILSPLARVWARRIAIVFMNLLHIGFGSTFVLGPFAWALCCFSTLLFTREDWELAVRTMKRRHRRRTVVYDATDQAAFFWCRVIKRLDKFQLLSFKPDPRTTGIVVVTPDGQKKQGTAATADIISTFPGGPLIGGPMRLPGIAQLAGLVGSLSGPVNRMLGLEEKRPREELVVAVGYRGELKDDLEHPHIDAYFMHDWLTEYGWRKFIGGCVLFVLGAFIFVYGVPMARKLGIQTSPAVLGEQGLWTRDRLIPGAGVVIGVIGAWMFVRPLFTMNLVTPSTAARKWVRVNAFVREALCLAFFCGAVNQALVELWVARPLRAPQPTETRVFAHKLRYLQGWFMFSPNPVMDDGVIVTDAITVDGRRVDPFSVVALHSDTLLPPNMDLLNAKSFGYNQIWSDYYNRMHMPANTAFRKPMKEYIFRLQERTGNANDTIVKGTVYWVHDMNARWRTWKSWGYNRKELFKFTNPDRDVQRKYREWLEAHGGKDPPEAPTPVPLPKDES